MIRYATKEDIPGLLGLAERFISETSFEADYDEIAAYKYFSQFIEHMEADIIIYDEGGISGGAMVAFAQEAQKQPFCYIAKFFVDPDSRNLGIGRDLTEAVLAWASLHGCSHVFSTATAGLDERNQRLFVNLMKKYGFEDVGPVLCAKVEDG